MSQYAFIKDNKVVNVTVGNNVTAEWIAAVKAEQGLDDIILATTTVGVGYDYNGTDFIPPKPFTSWIWNSTSKEWEAPVAMPTDKQVYAWNEDTKSWDVVTPPTT